MSLFTLTDIWSYNCDENNPHVFSHKSIVIGNIDNEEESDDDEKIVLASYSGLLRIIGTTLSGEDDNSQLKGTLLAELHLGAPILQIEAGYFLGLSEKLDLAILHPHRLGIYTITKLAGQIEYGSQYKVTLLYEHQLKRHAFNMCYGRFGGGGVSNVKPVGNNANTASINKKRTKDKKKDQLLQQQQLSNSSSSSSSTNRKKHFICVQSLDGTLSFFEQEVYTFSCYLPNFLLPGPIAYVPESDSFLTVSSGWHLECFKYSHLLLINENTNTNDEQRASVQTQESTLGKRLSPEWSFSLGEEAICDIKVLCNSSGNETRIILATFRHLYCFVISGELLWSKRLDFQMSCFISYFNKYNECITLATSAGSSESNDIGTLYIFCNTALKWAAKLPFSTVFVGKVKVSDIPGGIVLLSSNGQLLVECLGTEPSLFVAPSVESRDLDYESAEQELVSLRKIINAAGDQDLITAKDTTVEIKVEFEGQNSKWSEQCGIQMIVLVATVKLACRARVNDVRITIYTPSPIVCSQESVNIGDIVGRHNYTVEFHAENDAIPSDLACEIIVFYLSDNGIPHFIQKSGIRIPLFIIAKPFPILDKSGECKLTFSVNKPVLNLIAFYNDFEWNPDQVPTSLTFQLVGGEKVTILASTKTTTNPGAINLSRYRIQSDVIAGIHLVFRDFIERLRRKFGRNDSDLEISIIGDSEIPLFEEYFNEIEAHILRRRREIQFKEDINDRAAQLRAIQRRLLVRFRDKNIAPLAELETLLDGSLDHLLDVLNFMDQNELEKKKSESRVSGATKLMLELCLLLGKHKSEDVVFLTHALGPYISDFISDSGWEESIFTSLSYLKTQQVVSCSTFSQLDAAKLKKLLKSTFEKIIKQGASATTAIALQNQKATNESGKTEEVLAGNEIVERMASARARTARKCQPTSILDSIPEPEDGDNTRNTEGDSFDDDSRRPTVNRIKAEKEFEKIGTSRKASLEKEIDLQQNHLANGNSTNTQDDDNFW